MHPPTHPPTARPSATTTAAVAAPCNFNELFPSFLLSHEDPCPGSLTGSLAGGAPYCGGGAPVSGQQSPWAGCGPPARCASTA